MTLVPTPRAMSVDSLSAMQLEITSPNNRILLHSRDVGGVMIPAPASSAGDRLAIDDGEIARRVMLSKPSQPYVAGGEHVHRHLRIVGLISREWRLTRTPEAGVHTTNGPPSRSDQRSILSESQVFG